MGKKWTVFVSGLGQAALKKDPTYNKFGYWVNGRRKSSCMPPAQRSASCNGVNVSLDSEYEP